MRPGLVDDLAWARVRAVHAEPAAQRVAIDGPGTSTGVVVVGEAIRVAVVQEHEILRRGLLSSLASDPSLVVSTRWPASDPVDLAVVSTAAARQRRFPCPVIVCGDGEGREVSATNDVVGVLWCASLTTPRLLATVHAAACGLRVDCPPDPVAPLVQPRERRVLELIADGCTTREIAERMSYSERTIKTLIGALHVRLQARNRTHLVARALRQQII